MKSKEYGSQAFINAPLKSVYCCPKEKGLELKV